MEKYFAYGSNLLKEQMTKRCPSSETTPAVIATLSNFLLIFPRISTLTWKSCGTECDGGVSSVIEEKGTSTEGVIYTLTAADLAELDRNEGVLRGISERQAFGVRRSDNGVDETCWIYIAKPMENAPFRPCRRYIGTIIEGARQHGLSEGYIEQLSAIRSCETKL